MVTQTYRNAAWELLEQGFAELESGDVLLASKKGWEAGEQMVKAAAESRGWAHDDRRALHVVILGLVRETGSDEIIGLFSSGAMLQVNFYENWLPVEYVQDNMEDVRRLLELLQPLTE